MSQLRRHIQLVRSLFGHRNKIPAFIANLVVDQPISDRSQL
jgi:hypothetical protein